MSHWEVEMFPFGKGKRFPLGRGEVSHSEGETFPIGKQKRFPFGLRSVLGQCWDFLKSSIFTPQKAALNQNGEMAGRQAALACELSVEIYLRFNLGLDF
jgi:hypothetical protein